MALHFERTSSLHRLQPISEENEQQLDASDDFEMPPPRDKKRLKLDDVPLHQEEEDEQLRQKRALTEPAVEAKQTPAEGLDAESEAYVRQLEENWEQFTKKYDELFNGFSSKFSAIFEKLTTELQSKVQGTNSEVSRLLSEIQQHHMRNHQLKRKLSAIQAQTASLYSNING